MREPDYRSMRAAGMVAAIGIMLVLATVAGWGLGYWLDSLLGTGPWLMLLFTLLGIAAGFVEMFRIVLRVSKD